VVVRDRRIRGHTLRTFRQEARTETADLAKKVGIKTGYLRNIEGGSDQPSAFTANRLAVVLSELLGRTITVEDFSDPIDPQPPRRNTGNGA
jgi:DNA-binding XRE family transcriptional regulator